MGAGEPVLVGSWRSTRSCLLGALALLGVGHGCSADDGPSENSGGSSGSGGTGAAVTGGGGMVWGGGNSGSGNVPAGGAPAGGGSGGCTGPAPDGSPDGWEQYPGYCNCPVYYPGAKGKLPDPIEWEACPAPAPSNPTCRRMKTPWTTGKLAAPVEPKFWQDPASGKAYIQLGRNHLSDSPDRHLRLIAEADGVVHNAWLLADPKCWLSSEALGGGRYAYWVGRVDKPPNEVEGVLAGKIGELPDTVLEYPVTNGYHTNWRVTSTWLMRWTLGAVYARKWGSASEILVQSGSMDPEGFAAYGPRGTGDTLFWDVGSLVYHGVMSWTEATGARALVRYPGDYTRGASSFATDGKDMVWSYGEGKAPNDWYYPKQSIMAAPFSADPAVVEKTAKRLRSDPGHLSSLDLFSVGCGLAARVYVENPEAGADGSVDLLVVRLSDGVAWRWDTPAISTGFRLNSAIGVTCDEVFLEASFPDDAQTILRIRWDSLGASLPPD